MSTDLPGGASSADPGIDQLFQILTAGPTQNELADEQSALAMFRANISMPASPARPAPDRPSPASPADRRAPRRSVRHPFGGAARWGLRVVVAGVIALGGGMTAAAYAAVLPTPVQNLAHQVLWFAGVPQSHHQRHLGTSPGRSQHASAPSGQSGGSPGGQGQSSPAPAKTGPSARKSASPKPSPSPSSAATGPEVLSAAASSPNIMAGAQPVIDGRLTRSGTGISGVTVTLVERTLGQPLWHTVGTGQTTSAGNVVVTGPSLITNAVFRLRIAGVAHSPSVLVTVTPVVDVTLTPGAAKLRDLLAVSTQYAHRGNVVWLQVQSADGSWVSLRAKRLTAAGDATFILSGKRLAGESVRVLLVATLRHASATSNTATVPAPS